MARENIIVDELWDYFAEHREALANNLHLIASDEEQGIEIYLTEENGFPYFTVEVDGKQVYSIGTCSSLDAGMTYDHLLSMYIYPECEEDYGSPAGQADYEGLESDEPDDDERIREITGAVEDLLCVLLDADPYEAGLSPQDVDEIASIVEEYLFDECGYSVRHPILMNGAVVQYPFGDPDEDDDQKEDV